MYQIDFEYLAPEWGSIDMTLEKGLTDEEVREIALHEIEQSYPEAQDISILEVRSNEG